ncbi:hypothetical protein VCRA2114E365_40290 [Vibrio crassostreae]|uniref:Uncharacterized protein n=1 Tax=Vibrio crassostreae TaxID=246167 RepID=A0A822MUQ9_9VIBR|nr:hypothetical protein VCRA2110O177_100031 [Vibrio crassostreae]CAK1694853.1 hypothetical protein VCRA2110O172_100033 [Vibrio crassostreae]CAK1703820.1 hypothetical protein VCRA2110O181_100114 [Vibrio crassostreae]CAK1703896.1 hypothetical protein VCRA2110O180_100113 [Vibrio crassostreae]CAK1704130.1 hypothetical protein VCRA2113O198_100113 [Vibrio crassostreae]
MFVGLSQETVSEVGIYLFWNGLAVFTVFDLLYASRILILFPK